MIQLILIGVLIVILIKLSNIKVNSEMFKTKKLSDRRILITEAQGKYYPFYESTAWERFWGGGWPQWLKMYGYMEYCVHGFSTRKNCEKGILDYLRHNMNNKNIHLSELNIIDRYGAVEPYSLTYALD